MLGFMDFVQNSFLDLTNWDRDNSYGTLNLTPQRKNDSIYSEVARLTCPTDILDFTTPSSFRLHVSSLPSPNFASSYTVGTSGLLDGSLSYLYTSRSLADVATSSRHINLRLLLPGYRSLQALRKPDNASSGQIWQRGKRVDRPDALLYGRLYLPHSTLEALYMRRLGTKTQLKISCVSDSKLPNGGTLLAHLIHDQAKYCTEYLYSTDSALLGVRGLYNFGSEVTANASSPKERVTQAASISEGSSPDPVDPASNSHGRFSAGGEVYYGLLNKSGGLSAGLRFATLPSHTGFPYTMTLTLNPLMGGLSSTYSVHATPKLALSSRFEFNVYSYESELQVGTELWQSSQKQPIEDLSWARLKLGQELRPIGEQLDSDLSGCLKAKLNQRGSLGLLWEGRVKELLYSCGVMIDLRGGERMFKGVGIEFHYSP